MNCAFACRKCFYCEMPLPKRHEHDHFPSAQRHGGKIEVPTCVNCHELKDRTPFDRWDQTMRYEALAGLWAKATPIERLVLAKMFAIVEDANVVLVDRERVRSA